MIFFDIDGTLVDHKSAELAVALAFQKEHDEVFPEPARAVPYGIGGPEAWHRLQWRFKAAAGETAEARCRRAIFRGVHFRRHRLRETNYSSG